MSRNRRMTFKVVVHLLKMIYMRKEWPKTTNIDEKIEIILNNRCLEMSATAEAIGISEEK